MLESQNELSHSMLIRHHECTQELEFRHLNAVHRLRRDQQQNQHQTEYTSQVDYNRRLEMELRKKHLFELKMQPKTLKVKWSRFVESLRDQEGFLRGLFYGASRQRARKSLRYKSRLTLTQD